ncbi:hypothetical protein PanWU01x14_362020 [Parasponia andersonii]|uniref:Uncharacterized protein n=1 Tax=Parasponia andersonii TaxID=3476 RepID=A0A2P5A756_PARAD|nr:hypothetical protein PanWU01x14_362020 [Parasponia andersonii]
MCSSGQDLNIVIITLALELEKDWEHDMVDKCLMALGFVGAVFDGITKRLPMFFTGHMVNTIGSASTMDNDAFQRNINKNAVAML